MTPERCDQVIARVVAWHNRHPLATRITPGQVHSVGVVSLPFLEPGVEPVAASATAAADDVAAAGGPAANASKGWHPLTWWRERRRAAQLHALAGEDFLQPWPVQRVWRWVAHHGVAGRPLEPEAPQRQVEPEPGRTRPDGAGRNVQRQVITAAIGIDEQRLRLLLAPGAHGAILGTRHHSRPRRAAAAAGVAAAVLMLGAGLYGPGVPTMPAMTSGPLATSPASAPVRVAAVAPVAASKPAAEPEPEPEPETERDAVAETPAEPVAAGAGAAPPPDVDPRPGDITLGRLVPPLDRAQRQLLRRAGQALRSGDAAAAAPKAWALVSMPMNDRPRSQRVAAQLQAVALLQAVPLQAELMQVAGRWRAVCWPFASADDAEKVRLALADKGLRTEVIEF